MIERSIRFGAHGGLIGTLCLPDPAQHESRGAPAVGQILFNAGILHRVGPHRMNVRLARRLAAQGIPSLRFDLSGLGDSARAGADESYEKQAVIDLQAAMDALGKAAAVDRHALFGFCSGGRNSYAAATVDERVAGVVLYDTYAYPTPRSRLNRYRLLARQHGFFASVAASLRHRWSRLRDGLPATVGPSGRREPTKSEYAAWIHGLTARGVDIGVAFSGEGVNYNYREQFADSLRNLGVADRVAFAYWPDMDHSAMGLAAQANFLDWLEGWMVALDARHRRPQAVRVAANHAAGAP